MNNLVQTIIYVLLATAAVVAAVITGAANTSGGDHDQLRIAREEIGKDVFTDFTAANAVELEITTYDEEAARLKSFSVKRDDLGQWVIPSHNDYPADAEQQMSAAASAFSALKIADLIGTETSLHAEFAVIEPNSDTLEVSNTGVGTLITVRDDQGNEYSLIVGNTVSVGNEAGADPRMQKLFYAARRPTDEITFTVDLNMDVFDTDFSKWIENNLLDINGLDLTTIDINDYAIYQTQQGPTLAPRSNSSLSLDETDNIWQLNSMLQYDDQSSEPSVITLTDDEELNSERIDTLKTALENLEIDDVARKPDFLRSDLRASNESLSTPGVISALGQLGLYGDPSTEKDGLMELKSANGEIHVSLKTGVKYILRFGEVDTKTAGDETVKRFLFVTTRLDEAIIPQPELSPLPEGPANPAAAEEKDEEATTKPETPANPAAAEEKDEEATAKPETPANPTAAEKKDEEATAKPETPAPDEGCQDEPVATTETPAATVGDTPPQEGEPAEKPVAAPTATEKEDEDKPELAPVQLTPEQLKELRDQITKENERRTQEYEDKLAAARNRVRELNERFEKWYYLIDEKVYNQIHLSNTDLITAKSSALEDIKGLDEGGLDALGLPGLPGIPGLPSPTTPKP
ncbi:MAG TPA: DUF4340 domain-containing protein [Planctomycetes bacterium]|nr:DUF4340 domain-containing protein [Planctomycetota bacterium]